MALSIEVTRNGLVESSHLLHVAVTDADGRLVASSLDPSRITYWRSSAKPFQALPLLLDGAADRFGFDSKMLALACASHSSEPVHVALAKEMLERIGCEEKDLACGPHTPLSESVAHALIRDGRPPSPAYSNCSGKHAGMLAVARHHGFPLEGYERAGHPVQQRILDQVKRFTGLGDDGIHLGVDGCTAVCFALPLSAMATAYARFATGSAPAEARLRDAMWSHPELVAGTGRLCTAIMTAAPGEILAKVGAEGVYGAALPRVGFGIALKLESGDWSGNTVAILAVISRLLERFDPSAWDRLELERLGSFIEPRIVTTRGEQVGVRRARGALTFH